MDLILHLTDFAHVHPHGEMLVVLAAAFFLGVWGTKVILKRS